jgi:hypothetical protein
MEKKGSGFKKYIDNKPSGGLFPKFPPNYDANSLNSGMMYRFMYNMTHKPVDGSIVFEYVRN